MELRIGWGELVELINENGRLPDTVKGLEANEDQLLATVNLSTLGEFRVKARFAGYESGRARRAISGQGPKEQLLLGLSGLVRTGLALNDFILFQGCDLWIDTQKLLELAGVKGYTIETILSDEDGLSIRAGKKTA